MVKEYYPFNIVGEVTDFVSTLKFSVCELNCIVFHRILAVYYTELVVHWRQAKMKIYVYISRWNKEKDKPPIKNCWKLRLVQLLYLSFPTSIGLVQFCWSLKKFIPNCTRNHAITRYKLDFSWYLAFFTTGPAELQQEKAL